MQLILKCTNDARCRNLNNNQKLKIKRFYSTITLLISVFGIYLFDTITFMLNIIHNVIM